MLTGDLRKMKTALNSNGEANYALRLFDKASGELTTEIGLNEYIGKELSIQFLDKIHCTSCGVTVKKTYLGGLCYKCLNEAPEGSPCIIRPELCEAHLGKGRDVQWEEENHNQPHVVYLAATNVIKVGVTRKTQVPTRWIDQGAASAIRFAETPNRYLAGVLEVALKDAFTDKTNWRKMLTNETDDSLDLETAKWEMEELLPSDLAEYMVDDDEITEIAYPVLNYPNKVKSLNLSKTPLISGRLTGIRGQYLIFNEGEVFNVRSYAGYHVAVEL